MSSRKKSQSRRRFLIGSLGAVACPVAITSAPLISVAPSFPHPKFAIGEKVTPCVSKKEMYHSKSIVIGIAYNPEGHFLDGWWYLLRWSHIPESPWLVGKSDGSFWHESQIRALS